MENAIIIYLIKVTISLVIFYGLYMVCLKKDTFLRIRRIYFLFAIFFSLLYPAVSFEVAAAEKTQIPAFWLSEIEGGVMPVEKNTSVSVQSWIFIGLSFIALIMLLKFVFQMSSIIRLKIVNESEESDGCCIIKLSGKKVSPFSFFNWIFVGANVCNAEAVEIIAHERVHVRQWHSVDVVLAQLLCACFWWNPIVWLLRREMKVNLEYLADKGVLDEGFNTTAYQYVLLQVSNENTGISIINNFNVSQLKKRIAMMNKEKTSVFKSAKYLLAIPLGAVLLLGNAVQASPELVTSPLEEMLTPQSNNEQLLEEKVGVDQAPQKKTTEPFKIGEKKGDTYVTVEQMPTFPGGELEMHKFIGENLNYPADAVEAKIQGRVTLRFIVKSTGEVTDVSIIRGVHPSCDNEALRVVKSMPNWNPGKQNGKAVDVYFTLPILYKLKKDDNVTP
ncbi:M56 family metallopeptidase [Dysgonomonas sp. ZJ279]|uniref:M56 family metallopeptidase n=1 Tax=Dysgonomonas sp. ZJ279 TaxID=2709796 RepID=UPI0013E9F0F4|nr:M56 family metallopeptidase [Dysgonomonas sp. ZJ279]